jgi:tripartite-type tricarboxylate transporter receptor subunit TctC
MGNVQRLVLVAAALLAGMVLALPSPSAAQAWPQRPVKFLIPLGPGSGIDIGARLLADRLTARWGQPVVVENRPGGDALVAIGAFVGSNDDHLLLCAPTSSFTHHPYVHRNLPYKPSDLQPIFRISNTIIAFAVPASAGFASMADLVARARAQPGKLNWASVTGVLDLVFAGFLKNAGLEMTKVPYRNPVEAFNDVAAGRVEIALGALAIAQPHMQAGTIKVLALTNSIRAPAAPDIPTAQEAGVPDLTFDGLTGCFGRADMPLALRERIAADFAAAAADPVIAERLTLTGQVPNSGGPKEFGADIDAQRAKVADVAQRLGMAPTQ